MDTYHYLHTSSHRRLLEAMLSVLKIGMRYNAHGTKYVRHWSIQIAFHGFLKCILDLKRHSLGPDTSDLRTFATCLP